MTADLDRAASHIVRWRNDARIFVREVFEVEPDWWQDEVLAHVSRPGRKRVSMQACAGPGKTAVLAWVAWWFLVTQGEGNEHPKGAAVAITGDNLKDNLWTELAKWQQVSPLLMAEFEWTAERIKSRAYPKTWWLSARSWAKSANAEEQGRTLSGLHSQYILALLDESGEIPLAVKKSAEQALSNCTWGAILQAGNPTSTEGMLYAAATDEREDWEVIEINGDPENPRRASRVDLEWATKMVKRYGRDDPWVQAYILGRFPKAAFNQLATVEEVKEAFERAPKYEDYAHAAKVLGVDVAREGLNLSVITPRQGLMVFQPLELRGVTGLEGAGTLARKWNEWQADATFIDGGGGHGASWCDQLNVLGYTPVMVKGAERASTTRYRNRRSEMLWGIKEWLAKGGALPKVNRYLREMPNIYYTYRGDAIEFEDKDKTKVRMGGGGTDSPDYTDSLGFTFAHPVMPKMAPGTPTAANLRQVQQVIRKDPWAMDGGEPEDRFRPGESIAQW